MDEQGTTVSAQLEALARFIRERRLELHLTQVELGSRVGWNQERISVLEHAKYGLPSLPQLVRLAAALETSLGDLLNAMGYRTVESSGGALDEIPTEDSTRSVNEALYYVLQRLLDIETVDLHDVLNEVSDQLAQAMGADKVDAFIDEPESQSLVALGTSNTPMGRKQHQLGLHRIPRANRDRFAEAYETGQVYHTGHADRDPGIPVGIVQTLGIRSMILVPLRIGSEIRGLMNVCSAREDKFSEEERHFFEVVTLWVGMVARHAELAEAIQRRTAEDARRLAADELITILAHDLDNQLTPLKGRLDLFLRRAERNGAGRDVVDMQAAVRSVQRLQALVHDLLDEARLARGIFALSMQSTDLVVIANDVVEGLRGERDNIEVRAPDKLPAQVDELRVTQMLHNLVGNSVRHTPEGTPIVVTLKEVEQVEGTQAVIAIHDEGPGISPDILSSLFQRHALHPRSSGLGLGLFLARGIVDAHGGTLTVNSEAGRGTTFTVTLPVRGPVRQG